ncbi:MAG: hypothetical protein JSS77_08615 [Acidobacteria bacterium]|nr:hypothetical protein [Acidobacteriota bacterium]
MADPTTNTNHRWFDFVLIGLVALYELGIIVISLLWLFTNQLAFYKSKFGDIGSSKINEEVTYGLFMAGALGGAFYCMRALYHHLADAYTPALGPDGKSPLQHLNLRVWNLWYIFRPIQGGILALILLCLVKSHLLVVPELKSEDDLTSYYVLVALGFLAGFGSHELIQKIQEIISVVFAKAKLSGTDTVQKVKENKGQG